jgi:hypothetical protein
MGEKMFHFHDAIAVNQTRHISSHYDDVTKQSNRPILIFSVTAAIDAII